MGRRRAKRGDTDRQRLGADRGPRSRLPASGAWRARRACHGDGHDAGTRERRLEETMITRALHIAFAALIGMLMTAAHLHAQDRVAPARELYASAQYDAALEALNRLSADAASPDERQSIDLYRTLCLFAVGRRDEADRTIEEIIARDPLYRPADDLSPRTRTAFTDARKRLLPAIVQQQYADA